MCLLFFKGQKWWQDSSERLWCYHSLEWRLEYRRDAAFVSEADAPSPSMEYSHARLSQKPVKHCSLKHIFYVLIAKDVACTKHVLSQDWAGLSAGVTTPSCGGKYCVQAKAPAVRLAPASPLLPVATSELWCWWAIWLTSGSFWSLHCPDWGPGSSVISVISFCPMKSRLQGGERWMGSDGCLRFTLMYSWNVAVELGRDFSTLRT